MVVAGLDLQVAPLEGQDPTGGFQGEDGRGGLSQLESLGFLLSERQTAVAGETEVRRGQGDKSVGRPAGGGQ